MRHQKMAPHVKNFFENSYWEFKIQNIKNIKCYQENNLTRGESVIC